MRDAAARDAADAADEEAVAPPLKWAGGKRWLAPELAQLWRESRASRLVEPFCGGLGVALSLRPRRALLNDANEHLVNLYRQIASGRMAGDPASYQLDRDVYYRNRDEFNELVRDGQAGTLRAAQLFYYLNRTGFNGLCRFNRKNEFNVPFGSYATVNYRLDFAPLTRVLAGWEFTLGDFAALAVAPDDLVYADPPYDTPFTSYSAGGFAWADQERLVAWLAALPCPVVASNQATERVLDLYARHGFDVRTLPGPRRISRTGDRTPALEMLATRGVQLSVASA